MKLLILVRKLLSHKCSIIKAKIELIDLEQFVSATELWVSNFFTLYLEKVIKRFSPQALPTGWCYFKAENKTRKESKLPTCGEESTHMVHRALPGCSQRPHPTHPHPRPSVVLTEVPGKWLKSWTGEVRGVRPGCGPSSLAQDLQNCNNRLLNPDRSYSSMAKGCRRHTGKTLNGKKL